jgi:hypothetical protein
MAGDPLDPISLNVSGVESLIGSGMNKTSSGVLSDVEGVESEKFDVLDLKMDDIELLALRDKWEGRYQQYEGVIVQKQKKNKVYYKGGQMEGTPYIAEYPVAPNLQFEAAETFYAAALAKNPEPVVFSDNTQQGNEQADSVKTMLQYHADYLNLRAKLTRMTRQWSIYFLGVEKYGWDKTINEVSIEVRRVQDFIFDPNGSVDCSGHFDSYLGERITVSAEKLCELFPAKANEIIRLVDGKMGTECTYTEWWNDDYTFCSFKDIILEKSKNPFFNYEAEQVDELGLPQTVPGKNHFPKPLKPYTFLGVYSLGEQPHDITGLIEQNIPNQNRITKRTMQISTNLDHQNNFVAFSEDNFNQQTAKQALAGPEKGHGILVPQGVPIDKAIMRFPAESFPDAAFTELDTTKSDLKSSWGVLGTTAEQEQTDTTARGMMMNQQRDSTRIGGSIGDALEGVAKDNFNWLVQLYYVFYDEEHFGAVMGNLRAVEFTTFKNQDLNRKLMVSVAPDSMKAHDELTQINQAIEFYQMGAIGPKTLLKLANFPDPDESAMDGVLWKVDPMSYLQLNWPQLAQQIQQVQMQQMQMQAQAEQIGGQQQLQQEAQSGQQQIQQQGAQAEQSMQQQGAAANQQMEQKQQMHEQKLAHTEEAHKQKMELQPSKASGKLKAVPLKK